VLFSRLCTSCWYCAVVKADLHSGSIRVLALVEVFKGFPCFSTWISTKQLKNHYIRLLQHYHQLFICDQFRSLLGDVWLLQFKLSWITWDWVNLTESVVFLFSNSFSSIYLWWECEKDYLWFRMDYKKQLCPRVRNFEIFLFCNWIKPRCPISADGLDWTSNKVDPE
jgi:hypothetical protein